MVQPKVPQGSRLDLASTLPESEFTYSQVYVSSRTPDEYAQKTDPDSLLKDFIAASRAFALDQNQLKQCAHNAPGLIMPVRRSNPKLDSGLKRFPSVLQRILTSERFKAVHSAREALQNALGHSHDH